MGELGAAKEKKGKRPKGQMSLVGQSLGYGLALVSIGLWFNLVGYSEAFQGLGAANTSFEATRYAFYGGRIVVTALFVLLPLRFEKTCGAFSLVMPLVLCFGTLCYAVAFSQTVLSPVALGVVASSALGISYMWIDAMLYVAIARSLDFRYGLAVIALAQVAEQLSGVLASMVVSGPAQIVLCCLCALVPLAVLAMGKGRRAADTSMPLEGAAAHHFLLLVAMAGIAVVALGAVSSVGAWGKVRIDYAPTADALALAQNGLACVVALICTGGALSSSAGKPVSYRYQVAFLVLSCGLLFALCFDGTLVSHSFAAASVLTGVEYFSHILFWVVIVQAIRDLEKPAFFIAGIGMLPYSVFALLWILALDASVYTATILMFLLACALIATACIHPRLLYERGMGTLTRKRDLNEYGIEGEPFIPVERNGIAVLEAVEKRCALLGDQYGLTARETQVLSLLAQGRTKAIICQCLVLSEGTVKTHTAHIFSKMGVRSQQELIALLYDDAKG